MKAQHSSFTVLTFSYHCIDLAFLFEKLLMWLVSYWLTNQLIVLIKNAKKINKKIMQKPSTWFFFTILFSMWHFFECQLMFQWQCFLFQVRFYLKCCCLNLWLHVLRLLLCAQQGTGLLAKVSFNYFAIFIKQRSSSTATESSWGAERKSGAYFEFMNSWPWVQNRD